MPTKVDRFTCNACSKVYLEYSAALDCEGYHRSTKKELGKNHIRLSREWGGWIIFGPDVSHRTRQETFTELVLSYDEMDELIKFVEEYRKCK